MRRATAYQRGDEIFLHASSKTTTGVWILSDPVMAADRNDLACLGRAIIKALEGSREGVEHPTTWKGIFNPILHLAGAKSWGAFAKSAKCVEIEFETNRVSFVPTKNLGARDGFEPLAAHVQSSSPESEALGAALLSAFKAAA
jgi:hypothetical protein